MKAQVKEVSALSLRDSVSTKQVNNKPDILNSGFIDIVNNGQVNASARFIRLYIGEPGKLAIPLSVYSGVSSNSFQSYNTNAGSRSNDALVIQMINPLSGLVNFSSDGILYFRRQKVSLTRLGLLYHYGTRVLTGYRQGLTTNPLTGKPISFLSHFLSGGIYFQTGAWERTNSRNLGICWIAARYLFTKNHQKPLSDIMPGIKTNGIYHGWIAAWGIEINNLVNIKMIYYQYIRKPEIDYQQPIYQISFNYSLR